jgi:hypothetical protein
MDSIPTAFKVLVQEVNLGVTVVTGGDAIIGACGQDLVGLDLAEFGPLFLVIGLLGTATAAATEVVGLVGVHVDEVFFTNYRFNNKSEILGNGIAQGFTDQLTGVLTGEFDFEVFVPIGIDRKFAFLDPPGVIFNDGLELELGGDTIFLHSGPECIKFVASLGVEKHLASQVLAGFDLVSDDLFPGIVIGQEHAVVFTAPTLGPIGPIGTDRMKDLPGGDHLFGLGHGFA